MPLESEEAADATLLRIGMPAGSQLVIPLPANAVRAAAIRNGLSALNIGAHIPFPTLSRARRPLRPCSGAAFPLRASTRPNGPPSVPAIPAPPPDHTPPCAHPRNPE